MRRMNAYEILDSYKSIEPEDVDKCMEWALGKDGSGLPMREIPGRFNELHPELEPLYGHGCPKKGLVKMYEDWQNAIKP